MAKPSTNKNECLGEVQCLDCGGIEYVYRSKRRGGHLYGRCGACGINQKTGPAAQARFAAFQPVGTLQPGTGGASSTTNAATPTTAPERPRDAESVPAGTGTRPRPEALPHPVLTDPTTGPRSTSTGAAPATAAALPAADSEAAAEVTAEAAAAAPTAAAASKRGFSFGGLVLGLLIILMPALAMAKGK